MGLELWMDIVSRSRLQDHAYLVRTYMQYEKRKTCISIF